jgi:hypothetical protein
MCSTPYHRSCWKTEKDTVTDSDSVESEREKNTVGESVKWDRGRERDGDRDGRSRDKEIVERVWVEGARTDWRTFTSEVPC